MSTSSGIEVPPGGHVLRVKNMSTSAGTYKVVLYAEPNPYPNLPSPWRYTLVILEPGVTSVYDEGRHGVFSFIAPLTDPVQWAINGAIQAIHQSLPVYLSNWAAIDEVLAPAHQYLDQVLE